MALNAMCRRVLSEYEEMPGLSLTAKEAARLWGVSLDVSQNVLVSLVAGGFLKKGSSGYVRAFEVLASASRRSQHLV